jgi:hypothetical protein
MAAGCLRAIPSTPRARYPNQAACRAQSTSRMSPPGVLTTRLAGRLAVPTGRAAWPSRTNVRHPAAQVLTAQPFVLDGLPGPGRAGHGRWQGVDAPSARAASLASSAALPVPAPGPLQAEAVGPTLVGTLVPTRVSTPAIRVPHPSRVPRICPGHPPEGEVERPRRKVRFARLIQRPVRILGVPSARAASGGNLNLTR